MTSLTRSSQAKINYIAYKFHTNNNYNAILQTAIKFENRRRNKKLLKQFTKDVLSIIFFVASSLLLTVLLYN